AGGAREWGAGGAEAEGTLAVGQAGGLVQRGVDAHAEFRALQQRLARAVLAIDVAIAETAAIAEEIVVHRAVEAVLDAPDFAVALARADIAAGRAAMADARGELHIPFAVVPLRMGLVGEYPGVADLCQVAGKLSLHRAILVPAEIHLFVGAEHAQVGTAGVILVIANTTVTGDAAVHLVGD